MLLFTSNILNVNYEEFHVIGIPMVRFEVLKYRHVQHSDWKFDVDVFRLYLWSGFCAIRLI